MNYYISDLHFFCGSQIESGRINYDNRPYQTLEEMHEDMKKKWNRKVTNADTVYILGDIGMRGHSEELIALVAQLKGRKVLVKGNHDDLSDYRLQQLFFDIADYKEVSDSFKGKSYKLALSHYPILLWNGQHKGRILLYGHTHVTYEDWFFQKCVRDMNADPRLHHEGEQEFLAINVGCMMPYMDYEPRSLREILNQIGDYRRGLDFETPPAIPEKQLDSGKEQPW